jgi:hypothetical protein
MRVKSCLERLTMKQKGTRHLKCTGCVEVEARRSVVDGGVKKKQMHLSVRKELCKGVGRGCEYKEVGG